MSYNSKECAERGCFVFDPADKTLYVMYGTVLYSSGYQPSGPTEFCHIGKARNQQIKRVDSKHKFCTFLLLFKTLADGL